MLKGNHDRGKDAERRFFKTFEGSVIRYPTNDEDMYEHWDGAVDGVTYDVKALKYLRYGDPIPNPNIHWIELVNVRGDIGWLYGKANKIAFELYNDWMIIDRLKLVTFIEERNISEYTAEPEPYKIYNRKGTKDKIILANVSDLLPIADYLRPKIHDVYSL